MAHDLSIRTLERYPRYFEQDELAQRVLHAVTTGLVAALGTQIDQQRLDSTHVFSDMAQLGRTRLLAVAIKRFLTQVKRHDPAAYAGLPGVMPHQVHPEDRCVYWFYFFRIQPEAFRCDRAQFVKALAAEGAPCSAGYIAVPLHREPVFQQHGFFAGRWPAREFGLTTMDYTKHQTPEVEAILRTGIRVTIHEGMTEDYIAGVAEAIRKVARHYAA